MDTLTLVAAEPDKAALFFDVDGVLAPIVPRPEDSSVPPATRRELERLAGRYALVACITGRTSDVARAIVGVDGLRYVGQHGLELEASAARWADRVHAFAAAWPWPWQETKPLTAAYHYRLAPNETEARIELEAVAAAALAEGLRTRWGRMVLEILPPVDATKGTAVRHLLAESGLQRALYAGDDTTDLDGFAALDGLEAAVRVAVVSAEGPSELGERADVIVGSTDAFVELLRQL
ncbi:MAG TPA: trehalose-phosphatase [Gaiellaceae bacterium]|nr:trehalose-phosphatase [Gaiellaceae bacterium]